MRAGTIDFRGFEQDCSVGVRVVVNTCNTTLTFPVNGRYNSEPEHDMVKHELRVASYELQVTS